MFLKVANVCKLGRNISNLSMTCNESNKLYEKAVKVLFECNHPINIIELSSESHNYMKITENKNTFTISSFVQCFQCEKQLVDEEYIKEWNENLEIKIIDTLRKLSHIHSKFNEPYEIYINGFYDEVKKFHIQLKITKE
jgi:hypothetical protein